VRGGRESRICGVERGVSACRTIRRRVFGKAGGHLRGCQLHDAVPFTGPPACSRGWTFGGGHLALWLASQKTIPLKGVAALAAVSDLRRAHKLNLSNGAVEAFLGGGPEEFNDRYAATSPLDLLPLQVPQVLLHGTGDEIVPFELSRRFADASANARLVALPGAGHFELIDPRSQEWPTVLRNILSLIV